MINICGEMANDWGNMVNKWGGLYLARGVAALVAGHDGVVVQDQELGHDFGAPHNVVEEQLGKALRDNVAHLRISFYLKSYCQISY
jgi:hypothetical protein